MGAEKEPGPVCGWEDMHRTGPRSLVSPLRRSGPGMSHDSVYCDGKEFAADEPLSAQQALFVVLCSIGPVALFIFHFLRLLRPESWRACSAADHAARRAGRNAAGRSDPHRRRAAGRHRHGLDGPGPAAPGRAGIWENRRSRLASRVHLHPNDRMVALIGFQTAQMDDRRGVRPGRLAQAVRPTKVAEAGRRAASIRAGRARDRRPHQTGQAAFPRKAGRIGWPPRVPVGPAVLDRPSARRAGGRLDDQPDRFDGLAPGPHRYRRGPPARPPPAPGPSPARRGDHRRSRQTRLPGPRGAAERRYVPGRRRLGPGLKPPAAMPKAAPTRAKRTSSLFLSASKRRISAHAPIASKRAHDFSAILPLSLDETPAASLGSAAMGGFLRPGAAAGRWVGFCRRCVYARGWLPPESARRTFLRILLKALPGPRTRSHVSACEYFGW